MTDSYPKKDQDPGTRFSVEIQPVLPERFSRLDELANDLYYSWNRRVRGLFRHLDTDCWNAASHNPKVFLRRMRQHKLDEAANDPILLAEYRHVLSAYDTYLEQKPTLKIDNYLDTENDLVAYFSAEYGFHESMPIYAGGLGILAADYCKAMSNLWVPFVGIGILYREGYFSQRIDCDGTQIAERVRRDPCDLPVTPALDEHGNEVSVSVSLPGRALQLKVWLMRVGQIRLYLLDSDVPANTPEDRMLTAQLYGGDLLTRIQQEIILGIGGTRALRALGLKPTVWHINEGHAAFLILERCLEYVRDGMDFESALELTAANTAFTTHTPVPAGHDVFSHQDMRTFFSDTIKGLRITEERFLQLGQNPRQEMGFCSTTLAIHGSRYRNGVSRIHGDIAAKMESYMWPGIEIHENPIGYVTNGADVDTYLAHSWVALFEMYMGGGWRAKITDKNFWESFIDQIPNHVFLSVRKLLKAAAIDEIRRRAEIQYERCAQTKSLVGRLTANLNTRNLDTLLIGFARRFATYKRATLVFDDLDRLARLVNNPERPVTFVFAGKAHPNDVPGQALLKRIYEISLMPEFQGNVILLEDYNLSMTRELLPGVDVWLNTPDYPMEACGTSGMKAAMNGAINLSVLDGWWAEAYNGENGWAITPHPEFNQETRNKWEAQELMNILEYQVIPAYYSRNSDGEPDAWVQRSKSSMKTILPQFNTIRMAMDYLRQSYSPAARQGRRMKADGQAGARKLSAWKKCVAEAWPKVSATLGEPVATAVCSGESLPIEVKVQLNGLSADDVVVECIIGKETSTREFVPHRKASFKRVGESGDGCTLYHFDLFSSDATCEDGGLQHYKIRIYPYHELLSHPLECGLMLWL
jgi:starch phosphorylase